MEIELAYGQHTIPLEIPESNLLGVFRPQAAADTASEESLISESMANPIGTPSLREMVKRGQKIAIVTSDLTRPTPSVRLLPAILEELAAAGIPDEEVFIVMALGLHRPMSEEEIERALSPQIKRRFRVYNHDVNDTLRLGITSAGTPVEIFRPLVEADFRICLGNIEFHYFAGYSGGAKAVFPGCASKAGVTANHAMMTRPEAAAGQIEGNPVRKDLEEAAAMLGIDFILNAVVDGQHRIVGAFAGEVTAAHRKGCEMVARRGKVPIPRQGDIVIASAGGFPKDINFYQAQKALDNAAYFVRDGGIIILLAECPEGFGNQTFESWLLGAASPRELLEKIQQDFVLGGHKAAAIAAVQVRAPVYMVSNIPAGELRSGHLAPFQTLPEALEAALEELGPQSEILVLPQAASILPIVSL
jgi:nickel-dependent lactate racemase